MEKVIYLVSSSSGSLPVEVGDVLRDALAPELRALGALGVTVNLADDHVAAADALRMTSTATPPLAAISVWVDSAIDHLRAPFDAAIDAAVGDATVSAYLVTESVPMRSDRPLLDDGRVDGLAQLALFQRRPDLSVEEWLRIWKDSHTHVAIDLQDTFSYAQNVVTRVLTPGATPRDAIVEECFPAGALTDPHVFYDAVGDDERLARHQREMFESVQRFIDLSTIDVVPTSRYDR